MGTESNINRFRRSLRRMSDEALVDLYSLYGGAGMMGVWTPYHEDYAFTGMVEVGHTVESYGGRGFDRRTRAIQAELVSRGFDLAKL